jgi:hypothetical protein
VYKLREDDRKTISAVSRLADSARRTAGCIKEWKDDAAEHLVNGGCWYCKMDDTSADRCHLNDPAYRATPENIALHNMAATKLMGWARWFRWCKAAHPNNKDMWGAPVRELKWAGVISPSGRWMGDCLVEALKYWPQPKALSVNQVQPEPQAQVALDVADVAVVETAPTLLDEDGNVTAHAENELAEIFSR